MSGFLPNVNVLPLSPASVTDASVAPASTLAEATVAVPDSITYKPAIAASSQGVYKTWAEVMTAVAAVTTPLTIYIDPTGSVSTTLSIAAGTYNMKNATIKRLGANVSSNCILSFADGTLIKNLQILGNNIRLRTYNTTASFLDWDPAVSPDNSAAFGTFTMGLNSDIQNYGTQPIITINSTKWLVFIINFDGCIGYERGNGSTAYLVSIVGTPLVFGKFVNGLSSYLGTDHFFSGTTGTLYLASDGTAPMALSPATFPAFTGTYNTDYYSGGYPIPLANRPTSPKTGLPIFDTTIGRPMWYNGASWSSDKQITISATTSIWISNSTGNDANAGTSSGTALKTFAEFVNRYGSSPIISNGALLTIIFLDSTVAEDITFTPVLQGGRILIQGTLVQVGSGTFTSAPTLRAKATNTYLEITDSAQTWAPFVGTALLQNTTHDGYAWIAKDTGSHKARLTTLITTDITSFFGGSAEVTSSAISDAYKLWSMTDFTGRVYIKVNGVIDFSGATAGNLSVRYAKFSNAGGSVNFNADGTYLNLHSCIFATTVVLTSAIALNSFTTAAGSLVMEQSMITPSLADMAFSGPGTVIIDKGFLNQGKRLFANGSPVWLSDYMCADWAVYAVQINENGTILCNGSVSGTSATAGTFVFNVRNGTVQNISGTTWVLAVPETGADATVGAGFKMGNSGYTQGSPYSAGALLAETTYTFAHLDAAKGAGTGFGGGTSRLDCFASMSL